MSIALKVTDLSKSFGNKEVFKGLSLQLDKKSVTTVYGKSGIGKTTLLKCLVLLETPDNGSVEIEGINVFDKGEVVNESVVRKKLGIVFQDFYLWDNKSVISNIIESLVFVRKMSKSQALETSRPLLERLQLEKELFNKYPPELSRGQRQRVAIARTLVLEPEVVLLDEPTASLDKELVGQVISLIKFLQSNEKTVLIVTHDLGFGEQVSDAVYNFEDLV